MILSELIRKRAKGDLATAIPAISATPSNSQTTSVAAVATVAVASPAIGKSPTNMEGIDKEDQSGWKGDEAITSTWWLVHFLDREPLKVMRCPQASRVEILSYFPDAFGASPYAPVTRSPASPMSSDEESAVRAWLAWIEEADPVFIDETLDRCQREQDAREYFVGRAAAELPKPNVTPDDRRTCDQCANLISGRCQAASRGEIIASRDFYPIRDLPRRCEGYLPGIADVDRRTGRERWSVQPLS